jgi:hypothetical protein
MTPQQEALEKLIRALKLFGKVPDTPESREVWSLVYGAARCLGPIGWPLDVPAGPGGIGVCARCGVHAEIGDSICCASCDVPTEQVSSVLVRDICFVCARRCDWNVCSECKKTLRLRDTDHLYGDRRDEA